MSRKIQGIIILCVILLQTTTLAHFTPFKVIPNYTVAVLMALVFIYNEVESVFLAAVTGIVLDCLTGALFGVNTLLCIYLAICCVLISSVVYNRSVAVFIPVTFLLSFIYELLFGVFTSLLRQAVFPPAAILNIVLPVAVMNTIVFAPCYEILRRIRFGKRRKGIKYEQ